LKTTIANILTTLTLHLEPHEIVELRNAAHSMRHDGSEIEKLLEYNDDLRSLIEEFIKSSERSDLLD
jgi:hypothetical protein